VGVLARCKVQGELQLEGAIYTLQSMGTMRQGAPHRRRWKVEGGRWKVEGTRQGRLGHTTATLTGCTCGSCNVHFSHY